MRVAATGVTSCAAGRANTNTLHGTGGTFAAIDEASPCMCTMKTTKQPTQGRPASMVKVCGRGSASSGPVHKGWVGSKASFSFPYARMVSSQVSAEHDLAWSLITLSRLSCPPGTARGQTALPTCPATLALSPDTAIHHQLGLSPCRGPAVPAASQRFPIDLHCHPRTKQQHRVAMIWLLMITSTSAIQVTIFKLLLIAINLHTQQPNWIYSQGGRGQCLLFRLSCFLKQGLNLQGFDFFRSPCYEVMSKCLWSGDFLLP